MAVAVRAPSLTTTRFSQPVQTIADIEALEGRPYNSPISSRNLHDLFEATAQLHPDRPKRIVLLETLPVTAVGKIFKPALRDIAVQEKVRTEIDRIFDPDVAADILVDKDARLNTLVHISIGSNDQAQVRALTEGPTPLPQTYRTETRSS
ncbi:hypothetical protein ABID59_003463 [Bradyrhizobium sp. S3.3.6]